MQETIRIIQNWGSIFFAFKALLHSIALFEKSNDFWFMMVIGLREKRKDCFLFFMILFEQKIYFITSLALIFYQTYLVTSIWKDIKFNEIEKNFWPQSSISIWVSQDCECGFE